MNYQQVLTYLYERLPMFQRVGKVAFKKDLTNTLLLLEAIGNPHLQFKSIHVAGTNGKGSSSHALSAILQTAGYKTGLYTSPHLKSFTERIRVNGLEIDENAVAEFVTNNQEHIERINPSFFEVTVVMAFDYFAKKQVDIAVIETGLGGRLDSTNVIHPIVSLITMIGFDHADILGDTLDKIAGEKAGIIKAGTPVVIGANQPELDHVYEQYAEKVGATVHHADVICLPVDKTLLHQSFDLLKNDQVIFSSLETDITASYFLKNIPGVIKVVEIMNTLGFKISSDALMSGLSRVKGLTGLKGRWQIMHQLPLVVADVSHNEPGIEIMLNQVKSHVEGKLHLIIGVVKDKEVEKILRMLPVSASYYFTQSSVPRSMAADELQSRAQKVGIVGESFLNVNNAIAIARKNASQNDLILVCGSTFVVAEIEGL